MIATGLALSLRTITDFTYHGNDFWTFSFISLIASFVLCAIYIWLNKGLRNGLVNAISVILTIVFLGSGTLGQLNYLLDFTPADRQVVEVVDKQIIQHPRSNSYDCTVLLPNGEYVELTLSASVYKKINIGEDVIVTHYDGAFHIPFSIVETLPDTYENR